MVNSVVNIALYALRYVVVGSSLMGVLMTAIVLINLAMTGLIEMNGNVMGDLLALVQIWLPFNLSSLWAWVSVASISFVTYKLSITVYNMARNLINT